MDSCVVKRCKNDQLLTCWECGERVCKEHVRICERDKRHTLCPQHWAIRTRRGQRMPWCIQHSYDGAPLNP
jgi:hypothetical protein